MKSRMLTTISMLLAVACAKQKLGSTGSNTTGVSDPVKELGLDSIQGSDSAPPQALVCPTITDTDMKAALDKIDEKFHSVYTTATDDEKDAIASKLKGLLIILKGKTEQERKDFLKSLPKPIPSCPVVKSVVEGTYE